MRNEAMLVLVFYFFQKYAICVFLRTCKFCMFFLKSQVFLKKCYLSKYAVVGCKSMETFGCMSMPFGCMYAATFGCMYAVVGCKFCGDVWVHVYAFWVHRIALLLGSGLPMLRAVFVCL